MSEKRYQSGIVRRLERGEHSRPKYGTGKWNDFGRIQKSCETGIKPRWRRVHAKEEKIATIGKHMSLEWKCGFPTNDRVNTE